MTELTQQLPMETGYQKRPLPDRWIRRGDLPQRLRDLQSEHRLGDLLSRVLGVDGILRRMFENAQELAAFERAPVYADIQQMLAKLRERNEATAATTESPRG